MTHLRISNRKNYNVGGDMKITLDIPTERFRLSLVVDGYTLEEVKKLSEEHLKGILNTMITNKILAGYFKGKRLGLFTEEDLS